MKRIALFILLGFWFSYSFSQTKTSIAIDCNPTLNEKEIIYFDHLFSADDYDFKNKKIGFASFKVNRICGKPSIAMLSGSASPINKKEYFTAMAQDNCKKIVSKLLILDDEQKKISKGFDAIVLIVPQKKEKRLDVQKLSRLIEVFGYRTLNYPDNLDLAGKNDSDELTDEDVRLLNQIYQDRGFDFKGKKIAFMNPHLDGKEAIRTKKEFIEKIKKHLENDFLYPASEDVEMLSEEEKRESGGYDAMIVYQSKRYYRDQLIQILTNNIGKP